MSPAEVERMSDELLARVREVRANAKVDNGSYARCSACGNLAPGGGTSIHAVSNPGHVVTVTTVNIIIYEDKGKPIRATEREPQEHDRT